jgi:hypothetical protein
MNAAPLSVQPEGLRFRGLRRTNEQSFVFRPRELIIAGWTARDTQAMEEHIRELEDIGVPRPRTTPMYYRVAASLLTQSEAIEVVGTGSSGEAEVVLLHRDDGFWVTLGSDHTDRKLETVGVTLSKQICSKPIGRQCWHLDDLRGHWDSIILRSHIVNDGDTQLYQEGTLANLRAPEGLLEKLLDDGSAFPVGAAMFCGTVPVRGALQFSEHFALELVDPVLQRTLTHRYGVTALQIAD